MTRTFGWVGTEQEARALVDAVTGNCINPYDQTFGHAARCPAHNLLLDKYILDHLLEMRRVRAPKIRAEDRAWRIPS